MRNIQSSVKILLIILLGITVFWNCTGENKNPLSDAVISGSGTYLPSGGSGRISNSLIINVNYTGAYTVDNNHLIYITVSEGDERKGDFIRNGELLVFIPPNTITKTLSSKQGTIEISGITYSPVYVYALVDADGLDWSGSPSNPGEDYYPDSDGDPYVYYNGKYSSRIADFIELTPSNMPTIDLTFDDEYILTPR